jgi:REP element-mobilizing transposase RayT
MGHGRRFRKSSSFGESAPGKPHRFEHWYRDKTVYFITARCSNRYPAFASEEAKAIFWDRFLYWVKVYGFVPWIITLIDNHYHVIGYLKEGKNLGEMMRRIHGSVAKLVNDTLENRQRPFWRDAQHRNDYFDGCLRDELQCRRAFRYTLLQCKRHGICADPKDYRHTRIFIELERGIKRALEINAFMTNVPYKRYEQRHRPPVRPL